MNITHWNFFNPHDKIISGAGRYEIELFNNIQTFPDIEIKRLVGKSIFAKTPDDSNVNHATFQELAPLKLLKNLKNFVLTVHDIIPSAQFSVAQKIRHLWYLSEVCIKFADRIITDSNFTKKELTTRLIIPEEKIHVIPLGVSKEYEVYDKKTCGDIFNFSSDKKYILIVSSNKPWKNMELANKIIYKLHGEYQFVKIGYNEQLNNPNVINLGYIPEIQLPYLYNACDLFLNTSLYEGFGLPVLEAMACGCPVVSSNATSLPEVVKDAGILINPFDVDSFVFTIRNILNNADLYDTMKEKGLRNSREFTWERTAKETLNVYTKVLYTKK